MTTPLYLSPLDPNLENLKILHSWRSSKSVLEHSFKKEPGSLDFFIENFKTKYHSILTLPPDAIFYENKMVGLIYYENWFKPSSCLLSIFLDPSYIGKKIGSRALEVARSNLIEKQYKEVVAFVKIENKASEKAFENAGFTSLRNVQLYKYGKKFSCTKYQFIHRAPQETFIIAEAGSNCLAGNDSRTIDTAKIMIEEAARAGADAVKFQLYHKDRIYVPNAGAAPYLDQDINQLFEEYALSPALIESFYRHCQYVGIEFMCSFFSEEDFEIIDPFVQKHKIASYEIRHLRLLEKAARSKKPLFLSTGAATIEDIQWAKEVFEKNKGEGLSLMHCTAQYPASSSNLRCITSLQKEFSLPVGLSDHSAHPIYAPVAAVSLGASSIEKHFTLSRKLPGPDHSFAIEVKELKEMCEAVRETEKILGLAKKEIFPQERELASIARRGLQAISDIQKGDQLLEGVNVSILRPGLQRLGLHPKHIEKMEGKKAANFISQGSGIQHDDIVW